MEKMVLAPRDGRIYGKEEHWELVTDTPFLPRRTDLELVSIPSDWMPHAMWVDFPKVGELNPAGQDHAVGMLLKACLIPESWRGFILIFPGTVWRNPRDLRPEKRHVPILFGGRSGGWQMSWEHLVEGWPHSGRIVCVSQP